MWASILLACSVFISTGHFQWICFHPLGNHSSSLTFSQGLLITLNDSQIQQAIPIRFFKTINLPSGNSTGMPRSHNRHTTMHIPGVGGQCRDSVTNGLNSTAMDLAKAGRCGEVFELFASVKSHAHNLMRRLERVPIPKALNMIRSNQSEGAAQGSQQKSEGATKEKATHVATMKEHLCHQGLAMPLAHIVRHDIGDLMVSTDGSEGKTGFLPSFITAGFGIFAEIALGPVIKFICKVFGNVIGDAIQDVFTAQLTAMMTDTLKLQFASGLPDKIVTIVLALLPKPLSIKVCQGAKMVLEPVISRKVEANLVQFRARECVPQLYHLLSHNIHHSLANTIPSAVTHAVTHSLTHTLSRSLTDAIPNYYYCSYCFYYGTYCNYCYKKLDINANQRVWYEGKSKGLVSSTG